MANPLDLSIQDADAMRFALMANEGNGMASGGRVDPTDGQKRAGNYKKDHIRFNGMDLAIENPAGSIRSGVDPNGKPWSVKMSSHYGYVKGTEGADGDHVDVYLHPKADPKAPVFVFDQHHPDGKFDEHKAVLGVPHQKHAEAVYDAHFSDGSGPKRRRGVTAMSVGAFHDWAKSKHAKKPAEKFDPPKFAGGGPVHMAQGGDVNAMRLELAKPTTEFRNNEGRYPTQFKQAKTPKVVTAHASALVPTQDDFKKKTIKKYIQHPSDKKPDVVLDGKTGKFLIVDGHHRILADFSRGEDKIPVRVIGQTDLDSMRAALALGK